MKVQGINVETMLQHAAQFRKAYVKVCSHSHRIKDFSPSEIEILIFLSNNEHINTAKELAFYLQQSKALICRSVERLQTKGLLISVEDKLDRRIHHLVLQDDSDGAVTLIRQDRKSFTTAITKGIQEEEWQQMLQVMKKINNNIEQMMEDENYGKE